MPAVSPDYRLHRTRTTTARLVPTGATDIHHEYGSSAEERIRGHLIAHFLLPGRPEPNKGICTSFGWLSTNPEKHVATLWSDQVDPVANAAVHTHRWLTQPVVLGRPPTEDQVRAYYRALL